MGVLSREQGGFDENRDKKTMKQKIRAVRRRASRPVRPVDYEAVRAQILAKDLRRTIPADGMKKAFALPVTLGTDEKTRLAMDAAFFNNCALDSFSDTLAGHAIESGQFPYTSFVGYGVLQQVAQNGMIRNCIKTVADDVTRQWITVKGGEDTAPEKIEQLQRAQEKYGLRDLFNRAVAKVGFMGGAFIFIRTEGDAGQEPDLSLPLRLNSKCAELEKGDGLQFVVVDPVSVSPAEYNTIDPLRADYYKPQKWFVLGRPVHASRLLTLYANEPPLLLKPAYNFLGIPQAQILWDYVLHWNECRVAAQELVKKLSLLIYYTNAQDRMADMNGVQELDTVMEMLQHYRDNNSVFLANRETDQVDNVQTTVAGVSDVVRQAQEMIAAINRTPAVKLFGISPSGFNATGESDIRNYNDHIRSQQELYRPALMECLKAIQLVLWGEVDPAITFEWNELDLDNESSQAMTFNTRAMALATLKDRNAISADEMRQALRLEKSAHLDFLSGDAPEEEDADLETDDPDGGLLEQYRQKLGLTGGKLEEGGEKHEGEGAQAEGGEGS